MNSYYDTGLLLKLYTAEPEAPAMQAFVHHQAQAIREAWWLPSTGMGAAIAPVIRKRAGGHGFRSKNGLLPVMLRGRPSACFTFPPNHPKARAARPIEYIMRLST